MKIGDKFDIERTRGIMGAELARPAWYILTTPPQREVGAKAWLERMGVEEVWFPTETAFRPIPRGKRKKASYEKRIVPGYLFVLFPCAPVWDVLFAAGKGRVSGVVSLDERPYAIDEDVLAQMKQVPQRIAKIREEETAREKAERLQKAPKAGERAVLLAGPLAGMFVDVERIDRGIAHFILQGIRAKATVESMERLAASD